MKILVTGAAGLLGRTLIPRLLQEHNVIALVKNNIIQVSHECLDIITCDLTLPSAFQSIPYFDVMYYFAQSDNDKQFPEKADDVLNVNTIGFANLLQHAYKMGCHTVIYASTGSVYSTQNCNEDAIINASQLHDLYSISKLSAEYILQAYHSYYPKTVIARPFFMFGEKQDAKRLIPSLCRSINEENTILLDGKEGITLNPIYIEDAAHAFLNMLKLPVGNHLFNIAGTENVTLRTICNILANAIGKDAIFAERNPNSFTKVAPISRMIEQLYIPATTIETALIRTLNSLL